VHVPRAVIKDHCLANTKATTLLSARRQYYITISPFKGDKSTLHTFRAMVINFNLNPPRHYWIPAHT
jgi:hypothetical protein